MRSSSTEHTSASQWDGGLEVARTSTPTGRVMSGSLVSSSSSFQVPTRVRLFRFDQSEVDTARWSNDILRQYESRMRRGKVMLTELELVNHILGLLDVTKESLLVSNKEDGDFWINHNVFIIANGVEQPVEMFVTPYLNTRKLLRALFHFSKRSLVGSQLARLVQEFVEDFLGRHLLDVFRLSKDYSLNRLTLSTCLAERMRAVSLVYRIVSPVIDMDQWNSHTVDRFLAQFFTVILYAEVDYSARDDVRRLEASVFSLLNRYFDHIFKSGSVASIFDGEFIFYNDPKSSLLLGVRPSSCLLWSNCLVQSVRHGAVDARRLEGRSGEFDKLRKFSSYFDEYAGIAESEKFVSLADFIKSLERSARKCLEDNERLLISIANEGNALKIVLNEIMSVYCGFAVREMELGLFDCAGSVASSTIVVSCHDSLQISGFGSDSDLRWTVRCDSGQLSDFDIRPKLSWPLYYIIDNSLLANLNDCLRFLLKLIRARDLLSAMQLDESLLKHCGVSFRKVCNLVKLILKSLATVVDLFHCQLHSLIGSKIPLVMGSRSVCEARNHLTDLTSLLDSFTSNSLKNPAFGLVRSAIENLCASGEEIARRLEAHELEERDVDRILKAAMRESSLIGGIGKNMQGSVFNALHLFLS